MTRLLLLPIFLLSLAIPLHSQQPAKRLSIGLEQDVLPYATGGYFGCLWVGGGHWRVRALLAKATKPDFLLPDGFRDNTIQAYALVADYFLKPGFEGWWLGGGAVYWDSSIGADNSTETVSYKSYLINGSAGYAWKFYHNFYLSPWAGLHLRLGGDDPARVGGRDYKPPLLNPEASLKIGWYF